MSVTDLLTRAEFLCKKYEKYDLDKKEGVEVSKHDRFLVLYTSIQADIDAAMQFRTWPGVCHVALPWEHKNRREIEAYLKNLSVQKAADASIEKNRAVVATLNAEVRRAKATLKEQIPKLEKYATKKVKGVTPESLALRPDMVLSITAKIEEIPEGTAATRKAKINKGKKGKEVETIKIDAVSPEDIIRAGQAGKSKESEAFGQEVDQRAKKQDESLEMISEGLTTLGNMAQDINEELDKQVALVDEIDSKVDKAQTEMRNTNTRLKETLTKLRSSRNFVVDIILLIIILSIAAYLYKVISSKKKAAAAS